MSALDRKAGTGNDVGEYVGYVTPPGLCAGTLSGSFFTPPCIVSRTVHVLSMPELSDAMHSDTYDITVTDARLPNTPGSSPSSLVQTIYQ